MCQIVMFCMCQLNDSSPYPFEVGTIIPIFQKRKWGTERLNTFPKITYLVGGSDENQTQDNLASDTSEPFPHGGPQGNWPQIHVLGSISQRFWLGGPWLACWSLISIPRGLSPARRGHILKHWVSHETSPQVNSWAFTPPNTAVGFPSPPANASVGVWSAQNPLSHVVSLPLFARSFPVPTHMFKTSHAPLKKTKPKQHNHRWPHASSPTLSLAFTSSF